MMRLETAEADLVEAAPGSIRAYDAAINIASSIHAVPQLEELRGELEDGWEFLLKRYKYPPLTQPDAIRLLRVLPLEDRFKSKTAHLLRCELIHATLDTAPEYIAMSYVWGDLQNCQPVLVGEEEFVMITSSLQSALIYGTAGMPMYYWVDQICINQHDLVERNHQVRLMGDIFGEASVTMVWLGEEDETADAAFDMVERIAKCNLSPLRAYELLEGRDTEGLKAVLEAEDISCDASDLGWIGIKKLSSNPWFTRLWTFQEVVVSRDLLFMSGEHPFLLPKLAQAFMIGDLVCYRSSVAVVHLKLIVLHRDRWRAGRGSPLLDLLTDVGDEFYECTEPRDYVYALLGLQESLHSHAIDVDYTKTLTVVLLETARAIIDQTQSLSILHRRRFGYLEGLPSWVPDWTRRNSDVRINDNRLRFSCAGRLRHMHEKCEPGHLVTRGKVVARITKTAAHRFSEHEEAYLDADVATFLGADTLIPQLMTALQEKQEDVGDDTRVARARQKWLLATTFTAGLFQDEEESIFESSGDEAAPDLISVIAQRALVTGSYIKKCLGRKMAMLDSAVYPVGLIPDYAQRDDLVCIINGSETPLVLRRVDQHFEYIGECYVHGIMYGEAVDWDQEGGDRFEIK